VASHAHDVTGACLAEEFLMALRAPSELTAKVVALVRHHLAPALYIKNNATAKGYRRLARQLDQAHVSLTLLARLARADHHGRVGADGKSPPPDVAALFLAQAEAARVAKQATADVVLGRHLIARGFAPGRALGEILQRCREVQDETGWDDPEQILAVVLGERPT
jgi:tRNA nucleotidyltransferase (CCA-adding enzyme)